MDGSLDFQGRRDTQIKLRGQRIEITAVETAIRASINEPVGLAVDVINLSGHERDASLIAFLYLPRRLENAHQTDASVGILNDTLDLSATVRDIRSKLTHDLPPYMVPTLFVPLNRLPKLVSGKIDRKGLGLAVASLTAEQLGAYRLHQGESRRPTNAEEVLMRSLWATGMFPAF